MRSAPGCGADGPSSCSSIRSPQDQGFYLFMALITLIYLFFNRADRVEGTDLYFPAVALPSILGAMVAFNMVIGPAYTLAMEREDGTLLRARAVPHGLIGYVTGQVVVNSLGLVPSFAVILIPSALLFEGVMSQGAVGWLTVVWVVGLGLLATLPIGIMIGSLVPGVQKVGTWGMLPMLVLLGTSGIFFPIQELWGWVQARRAGLPGLLARSGDAIGVPARGRRGARGRRVVAHSADGDGADGVGRVRPAGRAGGAPADGAPSVGFAGGGRPAGSGPVGPVTSTGSPPG